MRLSPNRRGSTPSNAARPPQPSFAPPPSGWTRQWGWSCPDKGRMKPGRRWAGCSTCPELFAGKDPAPAGIWLQGRFLTWPGLAPMPARPYLALGALEVAGDDGMLGTVQHATQLLAQLKGRGPHQAWGLAADPDEDI